MYHHPFGVRRLAAAFATSAPPTNSPQPSLFLCVLCVLCGEYSSSPPRRSFCHPSLTHHLSSRPERPDLLLRAVFRRVGPRSGGIVAQAPRPGACLFFNFRFSSFVFRAPPPDR